jgi:DNA-binding response OmpR family regulator
MSDPAVLVLDDDPGVRQSLEVFLRRYGYRAVGAASIEEALRAVEAHPIQAMILDVRLDGIETGIDLLATLRKRRGLEKAPVVILTGSVLSDAEEMAITRHRGFLFYKPEGLPSVINFLDTLTGREQAH